MHTYWKIGWHASQDISALPQEVLHIQHYQLTLSALGCNQDKDPNQEHIQAEVIQTEPKSKQHPKYKDYYNIQ